MNKIERLAELYQQMADFTKPKCGNGCGSRMGKVGHCCEEFYCAVAMQAAKEDWGLELQPTGHATLPMMALDGTGCIAPPHVRPMCTLHVCQINSLGVLRDDVPWTKEYFKLRDALNEQEGECYGLPRF